jgi:hypothetical protein
MLYADGSVFGGIWRDDMKADGVFIDVGNNWICGEWDGFVAVKALARIKMSRAKCLYTGNIQQGQRYPLPPPPCCSCAANPCFSLANAP